MRGVVGSAPFLNISSLPFFEKLWRNVLELNLLTELGYDAVSCHVNVLGSG
jgi:hypothetical protein